MVMYWAPWINIIILLIILGTELTVILSDMSIFLGKRATCCEEEFF